MIDYTHVLRCEITFKAQTGLLFRSGRTGEFTDSSIERDNRNRLHINGYVWASLLRRSLIRLKDKEGLAASWGKMPKNNVRISPLWTEATLIEPGHYDCVVNPGNRISREWGTVEDGALYNDELAIPLASIPCRFAVFCRSKEEAERLQDVVADLLWVIDQGIENIGGGWAYGFGRLQSDAANLAVLDLKTKDGRNALWNQSFSGWQVKLKKAELNGRRPMINPARGWTALDVSAGVADGQMLAIHTKLPPLTGDMPADMPDTFVYSRPKLNKNKIQYVPVVTGKAFRQAVLSREIERRLRSMTNETACLNTSDEKRTPEKKGNTRFCECKRCLWFGDTYGAGIISVGDADIDKPVYETVHRIQLCEHSQQNNQLFSGEYLKSGRFHIKMLIDHARSEQTQSAECKDAVLKLLEEMKPGNAPSGWYRLGSTGTCTGQLVVHKINESPIGGCAE